MRYTIILHTLNEEKFISGILEDLCQQDFSDFEVIHVDGASSDRTCEVVTSYQGRLSLRSVQSPVRGVSAQKNHGASLAQGEYLIFIDADVRIPQSHFLSKLSHEIDRSKALIYFPHAKTAYSDPALKMTLALWNKAVEASQIFTTPLPSPGVGIFERHFFSHVGGFPDSPRHHMNLLFAEDHAILKNTKTCGVNGRYLSTIWYIISLRRYEREGWLSVVPRLILMAVELSLGKTFIQSQYEMGGHMYDEVMHDKDTNWLIHFSRGKTRPPRSS